MKTIKQTINHIIYEYDPNEFLPVYYNGELINRNDFIKYKAKRAFLRFSEAFDRLSKR